MRYYSEKVKHHPKYSFLIVDDEKEKLLVSYCTLTKNIPDILGVQLCQKKYRKRRDALDEELWLMMDNDFYGHFDFKACKEYLYDYEIDFNGGTPIEFGSCSSETERKRMAIRKEYSGSCPMVSSFNAAQALVNTMEKYRENDGLCHITQTKLADLIGYSQGFITQIIKRLNTEDICIEKMAPGQYRLYYTDLRKQGTFHALFRLMEKYETDQTFLKAQKEAEIARDFGITERTVKMFKAFVLTGCSK